MPLPIGLYGSATVEIAFTSGFATPAAERVWTDVSDWVEGAEGIEITYGRSDEVSTPEPNHLRLTLDNRDGRFTPAKASSPYYPNVKKGRPIRASVTYDGVDYVRFTGYVDEWPLRWPDGSDAESAVEVSASSRRARMGQTAPLRSAIREAILATGPDHYWPMTEGEDTNDASGRPVFRDWVDLDDDDKALGVFFTDEEKRPQWDEDGLRAVDEGAMVLFPDIKDGSLIGHLVSYIGSGAVGPATVMDGFTAEVLYRWAPPTNAFGFFTPLDLRSYQRTKSISLSMTKDSGGPTWITVELMWRDDGTYAVVENPVKSFTDSSELVALYPAEYVYVAGLATLRDGGLHHLAVTISDGTLATLYLDGTALGSVSLTTKVFDMALNNVIVGANSVGSANSAGHVATYSRILTDAEIATHAAAALSADETVAERMDRIAGYLAIPAAEVDAETTIAAPLGPQSQADRAAVDVLDELAASTGGVLYDTRDGNLYMQARNHRYNAATAVTLDATTQEIGADLAPVLDDRYLLNRVEIASLNSDTAPTVAIDEDSVAEYGVYATSMEVVSSDPREAEAMGSNALYRHAEPRVRVGQVTADLVNLDTMKRAAVLAADVGSRLDLVNLPNQASTDPMSLFIEGYTETIGATVHTITFNTTPGELDTSFRVGDPLDAGTRVVAF